MKTLADLLRRIADRLDPPLPDPFVGVLSPIELPPTRWICLDASATLVPIDLSEYSPQERPKRPEAITPLPPR